MVIDDTDAHLVQFSTTNSEGMTNEVRDQINYLQLLCY